MNTPLSFQHYLVLAGLLTGLALLTIETPKHRNYGMRYETTVRTIPKESGIKNEESEIKNEESGIKNEESEIKKSSESLNLKSLNLKSLNLESPCASFDYSLGAARLIGEEGVTSSELAEKLTINGLLEDNLPPMEMGMVNVTDEYAAYRMLPDGMLFNEDISIILPYDTAKLPPGFSPWDVMTYYYDEVYNRWIVIERDSVDVENRLIYSRVNHFTDFVNAVIKTPEMPETEAYVPTSIKDFVAPHPLDGLTLIDPPTPNNSGTANLYYQFELPPGRQGMQPNLVLSYNSSGGNGWLGVGWDISIPAITVETRWGVPRYDHQKESEVYLYNGEQLVNKNSGGRHEDMPHRTNQWKNRSDYSGNVQFYPRKEEAFDKIVRHGSKPTNYWWSVTDRHGITYFYGKKHNSNALDANAVLKDASGNIAHWALTETRDPHGNSVKYYYNVATAHGGKQIYLSRINYTGYETDEGECNIFFNRKEGREDILTSANYGFKQVTSQLLCNIEVRSSEIRSVFYSFYYENNYSSSYKTRLMDIFCGTESRGCDDFIYNIISETVDNIEFEYLIKDYRTHIEYYDYPESDELFGPVKTMNNLEDDQVKSFFLLNLFNADDGPGRATALGASAGRSWSLGGTLGVGLGPNICMTTVSLGGNFDYSESENEGLLTLIDLDGDGLADKVFKKDKKLYYRKQIATIDGDIYFGPKTALRNDKGDAITEFLHESSVTTTWGVQGSVAVYTASGAWPKTTSTTDIYFADVNGDGLPDLISDDQVWFNNLTDGVPVFKSYYTFLDENEQNDLPANNIQIPAVDTCGGVIFDGEVNDSIACRVEWEFIREIPFANNYDWRSDTSIHYEHEDYRYEFVTVPRPGSGTEPSVAHIETLVIYSALYYMDLNDLFIHHNWPSIILSSDSIIVDTWNHFRQIAYSDYPQNELLPPEAYAFFVLRHWIYFYHELETFFTPEANNLYVSCYNRFTDYFAEGFYPVFGFDDPDYISYIVNPEGIIVDTFYSGSICSYHRADIPENTSRGILLPGSTYPLSDPKYMCIIDTIFTYTGIQRDTIAIWEYKKDIICDIFSQPFWGDPDLDAVKVWIAPMDGKIDIRSVIEQLADSSESYQMSRGRNGVIYAIQIDREISYNFTDTNLQAGHTEQLWTQLILPDDLEVYENIFNDIEIKKGDIVYFRLQSNGNRDFDRVNWEQEITYTDKDTIMDQFGKNQAVYNSIKDFLVIGEDYFQAPADGSVRITGSLTASDIKHGNDFSSAILMIVRNGVAFSLYPILSNMSPITIDTNLDIINQGDEIKFVIASGDNQNLTWSNIHFTPRVEFRAQLSENANNIDTFVYYPSVNMKINNIYRYIVEVNSYADIWEFIRNAFEAHYTGKLFGPLYRGWGQFAYNNQIGDEYSPASAPIDITKLKLDRIFASQSAEDIDTTQYSTEAEEPDWGDQSQEAVTNAYTENGMYLPIANNSRWVEMLPDNKNHAWVGYGNVNYITKTMMTNTRMPGSNVGAEAPNITTYDHPVPASTEECPEVKIVRKMVENKLTNFSQGIGGGIYSAGTALSNGSSKVLTDYMDMNGDRYPDPIGEAYIQYTMPWGGIGSTLVELNANVAGMSESSTQSGDGGLNFGASYSTPSRTVAISPPNAKMTYKGNGGPSADLGNGNDEVEYLFLDINGDGLPDKVRKDGNVALNLGYSFAPLENWDYVHVRTGSGFNAGIGAGGSYDGEITNAVGNFNMAQASISGGLSLSYSDNNTEITLMDINGDGLPDRVRRIGSSFNHQMEVSYNMGNGSWSDTEIISVVKNLSFGTTYSEGINLGITAGFTIFGFLKFTIGVQSSICNRTFNKDKIQLVDINGDGYPDYVTSDKEKEIKVRYNQAGKTNLLKSVRNLSGGEIHLDYDMPLSSFEKPQRNWNMSVVKTKDPYTPVGVDITYATVEYKKPYYNRHERLDYGYETVIINQYNTEENPPQLYRFTEQCYTNNRYIKRGEKERETIYDADGRKWQETFFKAYMADMVNEEMVGDPACPGEVIPLLETVIIDYYWGEPTVQLTTGKSYKYDFKRNVTLYINLGDTSLYDERLETEIFYKSGTEHNLISLPDSVVTRGHDGTILRTRASTYDELGKATQIRQYNNDEVSEIDLKYDEYGNVGKMTLPPNKNGERMFYEYTYDDVMHAYPVRIENALGHYSTAQYDTRWGKPTQKTDINGQITEYEYDHWGRFTRLTAPYERNSNYTSPEHGKYTIKTSYSTLFYGNDLDDKHFRSHTYHFNPQERTQPIYTILFVDGFGKVIQTKKRSTIHGRDVVVVSGKTLYDCFGRVTKYYHPVVEDNEYDISGYGFVACWATSNNYYFNTQNDPATETAIKYDILNRQTSITLPDNTTSTTKYGFGQDAFGKRRFKTTSTDANGISMTQYTDYRGLPTSIHAPLNTVTKFMYNDWGELLQSIDPEELVTSYGYDQLGNMNSRTHPDAGKEAYTFDKAGNMISRQTQNLTDAGSGPIRYDYHYNQLTSISYPENPENNVYYTYGEEGNNHHETVNAVGRIYQLEDGSGYQRFSYGRLGEVTENIRTFVLPNESQSYTFKMNFQYDSWNRIQKIIYPDREEVSYHYNSGGDLESVTGFKRSTNQNVADQSFLYINNIHYDKFGNRTFIQYGNGTEVNYSYDILQRLSNMTSYGRSQANGALALMQNLNYRYDNVGNIKEVANNASPMNNGLGGRYVNNYIYDNLYRLIKSTGYNRDIQLYSLDMEYSDNGKITRKNQIAYSDQGSSIYSFYNDKRYHYNNTNNQLKNLNEGLIFKWDGNGNLLGYETRPEPPSLHAYAMVYILCKHCWDEENQMHGFLTNRTFGYYLYDGSGERVYKMNGSVSQVNINGKRFSQPKAEGITLYASPYLVATHTGYTKHYYAGEERIASKIGGGGLAEIGECLSDDFVRKSKRAQKRYDRTWECLGTLTPEIPGNNLNPDDLYARARLRPLNLTILPEVYNRDRTLETKSYFYHPDHLGSSSWITDVNGVAIQHLQYLPFGELRVNQRSTTWNSRYTFSAKEKDEESGYGYFGARYYNSDLSIWLSVDPMAHALPHQSPYVYCSNNPIRRIDPNGMLDGDFFDFSGNYLGTDGQKDGKVYLLKENAFKDKVSRKNASEAKAAASVETTYQELNEANNVYNRTETNGGHKEESSVVLDGIRTIVGKPGGDRSKGEKAEIDLPNEKGSTRSTSVHSHPFGEYDDGIIYIPESPSTQDRETFQKFQLNIIVGNSQYQMNLDGKTERVPQAVFYNSNAKTLGTLKMDPLRSILNIGRQKGNF